MKPHFWIALLMCAFASPAEACLNYTPQGLLKVQAKQERWLRKESNKIVFGTWSLVSSQDRDDGSWPLVNGVITVGGKHGKSRTLETYHSADINCGFPFYPESRAQGKFYLRKQYGSYRLVHFVPDRKNP